MPTYIASTISPKWNTKRPAARALDGIHDVHDLDAGCRERVCVIESSVALWSRYAIQQEADRHSTLRGLSTAVGPRYVDSGQTKSGATHDESPLLRFMEYGAFGSGERCAPPGPVRCSAAPPAHFRADPPHDGPSAASTAWTSQSTDASALADASATTRQLSSRAGARPFGCRLQPAMARTSTSWPSPIGPSCAGSPQ